MLIYTYKIKHIYCFVSERDSFTNTFTSTSLLLLIQIMSINISRLSISFSISITRSGCFYIQTEVVYYEYTAVTDSIYRSLFLIQSKIWIRWIGATGVNLLISIYCFKTKFFRFQDLGLKQDFLKTIWLWLDSLIICIVFWMCF